MDFERARLSKGLNASLRESFFTASVRSLFGVRCKNIIKGNGLKAIGREDDRDHRMRALVVGLLLVRPFL
jgi:hypothetical protein